MNIALEGHYEDTREYVYIIVKNVLRKCKNETIQQKRRGDKRHLLHASREGKREGRGEEYDQRDTHL